MTNEEIKNLTREDILSDWLIQKIMAEDKATRGLTIARIADHAKAFGQKGIFESMIKWFQKDEKEFLKKQEEETKKLQAQKTDLVNTTRFIIPDSPDRRCVHIDGGDKQSHNRADINQSEALPEFDKDI